MNKINDICNELEIKKKSTLKYNIKDLTKAIKHKLSKNEKVAEESKEDMYKKKTVKFENEGEGKTDKKILEVKDIKEIKETDQDVNPKGNCFILKLNYFNKLDAEGESVICLDIPIKDYEHLTLMEKIDYDRRPFISQLSDSILSEHILLSIFYLNSLFIPR